MQTAMKLTVPNACNENWNATTPVEQGRFCAACSTAVVDFTQMTDKEILNYIADKGSKLCGRFNNEQLERVLAPEPRSSFRWLHIINLVIAAFSGTVQASAQNNRKENASRIERNSQASKPEINTSNGGTVTGIVTNELTLLPIANVEIKIKGTDKKTITNIKGEFSLEAPGNVKELVLTMSALGYFEQEYTVSISSGKLNFYLQPVTLIEPENIDSLIPSTCVTVGTFMVMPKISLREKVQRDVMDKLPSLLQTKYLKLSPNPLVAGSSFNLDLTKLPAATYTIQVINLSGYIVHATTKTIGSENTSVTLYSEESWTSGVYWIRVISKANGKVYTSKMVVQ